MSNLNFAKLSSPESENLESYKWFSVTAFQDIIFRNAYAALDKNKIK